MSILMKLEAQIETGKAKEIIFQVQIVKPYIPPIKNDYKQKKTTFQITVLFQRLRIIILATFKCRLIGGC